MPWTWDKHQTNHAKLCVRRKAEGAPLYGSEINTDGAPQVPNFWWLFLRGPLTTLQCRGNFRWQTRPLSVHCGGGWRRKQPMSGFDGNVFVVFWFYKKVFWQGTVVCLVLSGIQNNFNIILWSKNMSFGNRQPVLLYLMWRIETYPFVFCLARMFQVHPGADEWESEFKWKCVTKITNPKKMLKGGNLTPKMIR